MGLFPRSLRSTEVNGCQQVHLLLAGPQKHEGPEVGDEGLSYPRPQPLVDGRQPLSGSDYEATARPDGSQGLSVLATGQKRPLVGNNPAERFGSALAGLNFALTVR